MPDEAPGAADAAVRRVGPAEVADVVSVLAASFADYPALRYVLGGGSEEPGGPEGRRGPHRLERLLGFFVGARLVRGEPILGIGPPGALRAVALISYPGRIQSPPSLVERREALWAALGSGARARYEDFGRATEPFGVDAPHLHLNMLGVRPSAQGTGLARRILDAVHTLSADSSWSEGVALTTEVESNVPLYEHFGYRVVGRARVGDAFTSWGMYRPDRGAGSGGGAVD